MFEHLVTGMRATCMCAMRPRPGCAFCTHRHVAGRDTARPELAPCHSPPALRCVCRPPRLQPPGPGCNPPEAVQVQQYKVQNLRARCAWSCWRSRLSSSAVSIVRVVMTGRGPMGHSQPNSPQQAQWRLRGPTCNALTSRESAHKSRSEKEIHGGTYRLLQYVCLTPHSLSRST
jgi:hypothetical protein